MYSTAGSLPPRPCWTTLPRFYRPGCNVVIIVKECRCSSGAAVVLTRIRVKNVRLVSGDHEADCMARLHLGELRGLEPREEQSRVREQTTFLPSKPFLGKLSLMLQPVPFPIRTECPPGACICDRDELLNNPDGDFRVLRLTREEEKKLVARIEAVTTYADLKHIQERMEAQLGLVLQITPSLREVRTVRGFSIQVAERPGLCRKIRQSVPTAVRKCLENNPAIVYAILDAHDLFRND